MQWIIENDVSACHCLAAMTLTMIFNKYVLHIICTTCFVLLCNVFIVPSGIFSVTGLNYSSSYEVKNWILLYSLIILIGGSTL